MNKPWLKRLLIDANARAALLFLAIWFGGWFAIVCGGLTLGGIARVVVQWEMERAFGKR